MAPLPPPLFVAQLPLNDEGEPRLQRLLIANRGEIACRVIETCRKLNIVSVAVYVDEDTTSQHIVLADESIGLGSIDQPQGNPYLNIDLLVHVATDAAVDAIHPGYGYLSENADFATAVANAGITFVGPSPGAMSTLGDKRSAKAYLREHDPTVPLIPGYAGSSNDQGTDIGKVAHDIGYPIMIKASAGGGGKGMRIVSDASQLHAELERAQSEAARFFGSSDCILEKYIEAGKHIEIQIIGDGHGNVVSLGERDCSVQRRHQKVIEETPSPWLSPEKRKEMSDVAVRIGKLLEYENAGTVEFVFDVATGNFYFLEVNTRLQVEHPITEEVTRLDIVSLQLFVAAGGNLMSLDPLKQVRQFGHAIECRLCAEDPRRDFYPGHGVIRLWKPASSTNSATRSVRFETGMATGSQVSIYFDSMIAKIVVWEPNRALARARMRRVLAETACVGVVTNQLFLQSCLSHHAFSDPAYTTSFIPQNLSSLLVSSYEMKHADVVSAMPLLASYLLNEVTKRLPSAAATRKPFSAIRSGFRNQAFDPVNDAHRQIVVSGHDATDRVAHVCSWTTGKQGEKPDDVIRGSVASLPVTNNDQSVAAAYNEFSNAVRASSLPSKADFDIITHIRHVKVAKAAHLNASPWIVAAAQVQIGSKEVELYLATDGLATGWSSGVTQAAQGIRVMCHVPMLGTWTDATCFSTLSYFENIGDNAAGASSQKLKALAAPMPCKVLSVLKSDGDKVESGEKVMVVESMKMEIAIMASTEGTFKSNVQENDAVDEGTVLCVVD